MDLFFCILDEHCAFDLLKPFKCRQMLRCSGSINYIFNSVALNLTKLILKLKVLGLSFAQNVRLQDPARAEEEQWPLQKRLYRELWRCKT